MTRITYQMTPTDKTNDRRRQGSDIFNFFSIKDEVCIDFKADHINTAGAKDLSDNIFSFNDETLIKVQGLFGPNASGKSSILKAADVAQSTGRNTLFISRASQMDRKIAKKIYTVLPTYLQVGANTISSIPMQQTVEEINLYMKHKINPDVSFHLEAEESAGTIQIFSLLLLLLDVCKNGKTLILCEGE